MDNRNKKSHKKMIAAIKAELEEFHGSDAALFFPKTRPAATDEQLAKLETQWGRPLSPPYKHFLKVTNGLENFQGSHLLLGTEDHFETWATEQVEFKLEF